MMYGPLAPATRDALTYSCSRRVRNWPRINRASVTQPMRPIARKMFIKPGPRQLTNIKHQQHLRNRVDHIDDPHQDVVDPATVVAGDRPDRNRDQQHDDVRDDADDQRDPGAVHDPAEDVAPVLVEPHRPGPARASTGPGRTSTTSLSPYGAGRDDRSAEDTRPGSRYDERDDDDQPDRRASRLRISRRQASPQRLACCRAETSVSAPSAPSRRLPPPPSAPAVRWHRPAARGRRRRSAGRCDIALIAVAALVPNPRVDHPVERCRR